MTLTTPISQGAGRPRSLTSRCCMAACRRRFRRRSGRPAMWVVKLGGSLHDAPALRRWLERLATAPGPARIVVPGGGPFADTVRDAAADARLRRACRPPHGDPGHAAVRPRPAGAGAAAGAGRDRRPSCAPHGRRLAALAACRPARSIEASWDVTSDSLACWLATRLGAERPRAGEIGRDRARRWRRGTAVRTGSG